MQRFSLLEKSFNEQLAKMNADLELCNNNYLSEQENKISLEKEQIALKYQLNESNRRIAEWHKTKDEAMQYAKAAVYEVAQKLSSDLITEHKKETEQTQKDGKEKIEEKTSKLDHQFQHLVNIVSHLDAKVKESHETVDLVKRALLSPTGSGALAEITLENILKSSGLSPGIDFIMQYAINQNFENNRLRPDAIVFLPAGNIMVIDSKSSKFFTEMAINADNKELNIKLKNSMKNHLKELSAKDYTEALRHCLNKNDLPHKIKHISTIMFLPSEVALEKLQYLDNEFMQRAWALNIFPAGPISIINILSHAKFMIFQEKQQGNQVIILEEVRKLLATIANIYDHIKKVGNSIQSAASNYDKLAGSFNSSMLPKARNIQKFGITLPVNKSLASYLERYQLVSTSDVMLDADEILLEENQMLEESHHENY